MAGRHGVTVTEMRPSGRIEVDGSILNARSKEGWLDQGVAVIVTGEFGGEVEICRADEQHDALANKVKPTGG